METVVALNLSFDTITWVVVDKNRRLIDWRRNRFFERPTFRYNHLLYQDRVSFFGFCFTALQHILGHFGRGQLTWPHCSWASLLDSLPVLSAHSFASNWQLLFLNQRKRENGRRNVFMTKSPRKNMPDVGIELRAACMPSEYASDRATAPGKRTR